MVDVSEIQELVWHVVNCTRALAVGLVGLKRDPYIFMVCWIKFPFAVVAGPGKAKTRSNTGESNDQIADTLPSRCPIVTDAARDPDGPKPPTPTAEYTALDECHSVNWPAVRPAEVRGVASNVPKASPYTVVC